MMEGSTIEWLFSGAGRIYTKQWQSNEMYARKRYNDAVAAAYKSSDMVTLLVTAWEEYMAELRCINSSGLRAAPSCIPGQFHVECKGRIPPQYSAIYTTVPWWPVLNVSKTAARAFRGYACAAAFIEEKNK